MKIVQKSLDEIPVLKNDLEDIQKKNVDLNNEFDLHKINSEQEQEQLLNSFESHKKDTLKTLEIKDKEIHKISCEHDEQRLCLWDILQCVWKQCGILVYHSHSS